MALIDEEVEGHECRKLEDFWIIDDIVWMGDGVRYYPIKPTHSEQPRKNNRGWNRTNVTVLLAYRVFITGVGLRVVSEGQSVQESEKYPMPFSVNP
jgi:hypothetical protein